MYHDLHDKTAIITGSGKKTGIGYAIARKLAESGANIVIADLGATPGEHGPVATGKRDEMDGLAQGLCEDFDVKAMAVDLDVTSPESIAQMVEKVKAALGSVEILCNNAGASFGVPNMAHLYDEALWMRTLDVNLHGVFRVTRAVLPLMIVSKASIINTASRAGKVPPVFNGAYAVAKAGVIMLSKVMARELGAMGIRVNAICPGQVMTDLETWRFGLEADFTGESFDQRKEEMCKTIPLGRIGEAAEVGNIVAFLASDVSSYITGQAINVTGGQLMEL